MVITNTSNETTVFWHLDEIDIDATLNSSKRRWSLPRCHYDRWQWTNGS